MARNVDGLWDLESSVLQPWGNEFQHQPARLWKKNLSLCLWKGRKPSQHPGFTVWDPEQRTQPHCVWPSDLQNYELINGCLFTLLSSVTLHSKGKLTKSAVQSTDADS